MNSRSSSRMPRLILVIILLISTAFPAAYAHTDMSARRKDTGMVVAVAWREDYTEDYWKGIFEALDPSVEPIMLEQVLYNGVTYESGHVSGSCTEESGMLSAEYAQRLRTDYMNSNVADVVSAFDFDMVLFTGGPDISPSLQLTPDVERNAGEQYDAARDISDYALMSYCLAQDIPVFGICRGMQILAVVSGCSIQQDIPAYYAQMGKAYKEYHRMSPDNANRDFVPHDVYITDANSLFYEFAQTDVIKNVPSWHHQFVLSVEDAVLNVTATTTLGGIEIIEAIERTDRALAIGIQYHPEIVINKYIHGEANVGDYTDKDDVVAFFRRLFDYAASLGDVEKAA